MAWNDEEADWRALPITGAIVAGAVISPWFNPTMDYLGARAILVLAILVGLMTVPALAAWGD